jgi:uncharacterized protein (DUF934 family)
MTVIVTDHGFAPDDWAGPLPAITDLPEAANQPGSAPAPRAISLPPGAQPDQVAPLLDRVQMVRIEFASFADGRGLTLGRCLRDAGYLGRLRAAGPLIADQYTMIRRTGFDEVELPDHIAARQPEDQWLFRANWRGQDYRSRLRA